MGRLIRFSPVDVRVVLGVAALVTAWKFVSVDYSALGDLVPGQPVFPYAWGWADRLAGAIHRLFIAHPDLIRPVQIGSALSLVAGTALNRKAVSIPGLAGVVAVEMVALQFRAFLYDLDLPVSALLIALLFSWRPLDRPGGRVTPEATRIGVALVAFVGCAYALAGWSKLHADPLWFLHARLDLLYTVMDVWHSVRLVPWMEPIARALSRLFAAAPLVGAVGALATLLGELFWWTSIGSRWARLTIPPVMFASHLVIFLGSGILFLGWALVGLALVVPWRALVASTNCLAPASGAQTPPRLDPRMSLAIVAGLAMPLAPTLLGGGMLPFPLARYDIFGWSYAVVEGQSTAYRLGYRDPRTGALAFIPLHHGGFLDCRSISGPAVQIRALAAAGTPEEAEAPCARLAQYVRALRRFGSDGWLLGSLGHPQHIVGASTAVDSALLREPLLLRGDWVVSPTSARVTWRRIGRVERAGDGRILCRLERAD